MTDSTLTRTQKAREKGNCEFEKKNYKAAESFYHKALDILPPLGVSKPDEPSERAILHTNLVLVYIRMGRTDKAINQAKRSIQADRSHFKVCAHSQFTRKNMPCDFMLLFVGSFLHCFVF